MILSKQKCCLLLTGVSKESKKKLRTKRAFWQQEVWVCESITFLVDNIYVQFEGMVYQQIVEISMGTNCVTLIAD